MDRTAIALVDHYGDGVTVEQGELGGLLAKLIADRGWNQTRLAELSGVSSSHISRVLHGGSNASPETLDALAAALDVEPSLLHRAYAAQMGLRMTEIPIDDPDFKAIMADWPYLPAAVKAAHRASIETFVRTHRRLTQTGDEGDPPDGSTTGGDTE